MRRLSLLKSRWTITTAELEQPKETQTTEQTIEIKQETFTEEVVIPTGEEAQPSEIQVE